jgi:hypothetical protein
VAALTTAAAVIGIVGFATFRLDGVPQRFPPEIRRLVTYKFDPARSYRSGMCFRTSTTNPDPVFHPSDFASECGRQDPGKRSLMIWGDSFGASLYEGLKDAFPDTSVEQFTESLCPPIFDLAEGTITCPATNDFVFRTIQAHPPDEILLVANWHLYRAWPRVAQTITTLHQQGVRNVSIVGSLPTWADTGNLPEIVGRIAVRNNLSAPPVRLFPDGFESQLKGDLELRDLAVANGAGYVSPIRLLCDAQQGCLVRDTDGPEPLTPVAFDYAHLTDVGSRLLGRLIRRQRAASDRE